MSRQDGYRWAQKEKRKQKRKEEQNKAVFKQDVGVIVTDYRTGGTFLSLSLDSHPRIYCCRDEPLARSSCYFRHMPDPVPETILKVVLDQGLADICLCKLAYRQIRINVYRFLQSVRPKVIHLVRKNTLRAACSLYFHHLIRGGQVGDEDSGRALRMWSSVDERKGDPVPLVLNPDELLARMEGRERSKSRWVERLKTFDTLVISYEELVGGEGKEASCIPEPCAKKLCAFLKVGYSPLCSASKKVNAYPLSRLIGNWEDVKKAVQGTEWERWLDGE